MNFTPSLMMEAKIMEGDALALIVPLTQGNANVSIRTLKPGDTLVIKKINGFEYEGDALFESEQAEPIEVSLFHADMSTKNQPNNRYHMGIMVADAVQQILAQMEKAESIERRAVQAKAITKAKARGIRFGRPTKETPENFGMLVEQWESGELSMSEVLAQTGFKQSTFYNRLKEYRNSR